MVILNQKLSSVRGTGPEAKLLGALAEKTEAIVGIVFDKLLELARSTLDRAEEVILLAVAGNGIATASKLSEECSLPRSTFWFNLRKLAKKGLVEFGDSKPVILTPLGATLTRHSSIVERLAVDQKVACASQADGTILEIIK